MPVITALMRHSNTAIQLTLFRILLDLILAYILQGIYNKKAKNKTLSSFKASRVRNRIILKQTFKLIKIKRQQKITKKYSF
jgi:hypothetical protein